MAVVKNTMDLAGVTAKQFQSPSMQTAFTKGFATTAAVSEDRVAITGFKEVTTRRATNLEVDTQVTLVGTEATATKTSTISTKLSDKTALQANIQTEATNSGATGLSSATVESTTTAAPVITTGTNPALNGGGGSSSSSSDGAMLWIIIGCSVGGAVLIAAIGGAAFMMMGSGNGGGGGSSSVTVKIDEPAAAEPQPPPGGSYMKNGIWMDNNGRPVGDAKHPGIQ